MKKLVLFLTALVIAIGIFGTLGSNNAGAEKAAFGHDDLETVKQLSLEFLRQRMPERGIVADDSNFRVTKVFVDVDFRRFDRFGQRTGEKSFSV